MWLSRSWRVGRDYVIEKIFVAEVAKIRPRLDHLRSPRSPDREITCVPVLGFIVSTIIEVEGRRRANFIATVGKIGKDFFLPPSTNTNHVFPVTFHKKAHVPVLEAVAVWFCKSFRA